MTVRSAEELCSRLMLDANEESTDGIVGDCKPHSPTAWEWMIRRNDGKSSFRGNSV